MMKAGHPTNIGTTRLRMTLESMLPTIDSMLSAMGEPLRRFPQALSLERAHLLTTCKQAVVSLLSVGPVRSPRGSFALCGERQETRQTSFPARRKPLLAKVQQRLSP